MVQTQIRQATSQIVLYSCGHSAELVGWHSNEEIEELSKKKCLKCSIKDIGIVKDLASKQARMEIGLDIATETEYFWKKVYNHFNIPENIKGGLFELLTLLLDDTDEYQIKNIESFSFCRGERRAINKSIKENLQIFTPLLRGIKIAKYEIKNCSVIFYLEVPDKFYESNFKGEFYEN